MQCKFVLLMNEDTSAIQHHEIYSMCVFCVSTCLSVCVLHVCPLSVSLCSWYRCKVCPLTFFSKSDMQIHSKTHTEAKAHKCPHCTKSFANASYLAQHLRIHLGVKPYRCSYCEKCFRQLSHLQQHTRSDLITVGFVILALPTKALMTITYFIFSAGAAHNNVLLSIKLIGCGGI